MNTSVNAENSSSARLRSLRPVSSRLHQHQLHRMPSMQWLFRSNIPRHRRSLLNPDPQKRNFFGMGEVLSVLANPAETVRSLTESNRLLAEARREIEEQRERAQIRPKHTFTRLPGFFPRKAEMQTIERTLGGEPAFTVLFGASSVGKTALLREVLSQPQFHVLHFDLRIAGFADLPSLYTRLSTQMEQYFEDIASNMEGYEEFQKEAWCFKHDRINVQNRIADSNDSRARIRTSDVARLMELFQVISALCFQKSNSQTNILQSSLLKYLEPVLIQSTDTMKCLLDSMLVLTKQDKLCHVIHATSDPFYQTWLRQLNVMQHCKIINIGDCTKAETRTFFRDHLIPRVPERLRGRLEFEGLYEAFGGKLAHWQDFITDFVNSHGQLDIRSSSHFLQAHALLNLHIIHSSQAATGAPPGPGDNDTSYTASARESLHPNLGPAGFKIYSPISNPQQGYYSADFTAMQLLKVMSRLTKPDTPYLPYFMLCRELGVRAVDGMVKGRVLDLRWIEPVSKENGEEERARASLTGYPGHGLPMPPPMNYNAAMAASASGTAVNDQLGPPPPIDEEDMIPVPDMEMRRNIHSGVPVDPYEEDYIELVGPKLIPITPIMRYAMAEVIEEYEDDQSNSEYASLSDPEEY
ncbi:hypothetical protein AN958_02631 [Leucoagaricus sp. SymC.cos]|nr:hypothetical protein AN958_02631 [Leucoagaricus sp. SymC.cos]